MPTNKSDVFFPKQEIKNVKTVTALATDADGKYPDRLPGRISMCACSLRTAPSCMNGALPGTMIWDLAVASDGQRYAACDGGMMYMLRDEDKTPLQVACSVPDKQVYALTSGTHGEVYLATAPRGKVYRLNPQRASGGDV